MGAATELPSTSLYSLEAVSMPYNGDVLLSVRFLAMGVHVTTL
jgi:hypothetical protein